jgi:hypothetical protein
VCVKMSIYISMWLLGKSWLTSVVGFFKVSYVVFTCLVCVCVLPHT